VTTIILARHGETDWNREGRVQGHSDVPLNDVGRAQADALADALADERLDAVYASDLARAFETARIVAERQGLEVLPLPGLREKHFGTWEGLTDAEVFERFPHAVGGAWGDGETTDEMAERVVAALRHIAAEQQGGRVLVVTHGGPVRAVLRSCGVSADGAIVNCHVCRFRYEDGALQAVDDV
jgi:broad specificity phosphatase PhoE